MDLIPEEEAKAKVLSLQRKYFRWSENGTQKLGRFYNLLYNPLILSLAWHLLRKNKGSRTAGTDGVNVKTIEEGPGVVPWLNGIRDKLRAKTYQAHLLKRVWISKQPGSSKKRPLGIPTLEDRLGQMALKLVLEPIYEAKFRGCSWGFRPCRGPLRALGQIWQFVVPHYGYGWVIEADFRACFDRIPHGLLLEQMRRTIRDERVLGLVRAFLKAGVLERDQIHYPVTGSPQGGVISPLLANIFLHQLDELFDDRYEKYRQLKPYLRSKWVKAGKPVVKLVRYCDDFVLLVRGTRDQAEELLHELRNFVRDTLRMELAEEKTGIAPLDEGFVFLGYRMSRGTSPRTRKRISIARPSKEAVIKFRRKVKELTSRAKATWEVDDIIRRLNNLIRGWGKYFHQGVVSRLFSKLDHYIFFRMQKWLRRKHQHRTLRWIYSRYYRRDITGRLRWIGKEHHLTNLRDEFKCNYLRGYGEQIETPYSAPVTIQLPLSFAVWDMNNLRDMESSLRRWRSGGEPDDGKLSRPVLRAARGNVP